METLDVVNTILNTITAVAVARTARSLTSFLTSLKRESRRLESILQREDE